MTTLFTLKERNDVDLFGGEGVEEFGVGGGGGGDLGGEEVKVLVVQGWDGGAEGEVFTGAVFGKGVDGRDVVKGGKCLCKEVEFWSGKDVIGRGPLHPLGLHDAEGGEEFL